MADWQDAVLETPGGIRLLLEVTAGARSATFPTGFNPWRQGRIGIRVHAPAQEGKANAEVAQVVAVFFERPPSSALVVAGHLDPRKTVEVQGVTRQIAIGRLGPALGQA